MEGNRKGSNIELRRPSEDRRENRPARLAGCSTNTRATLRWSSSAVRFARRRGWRGGWLCSPQTGSLESSGEARFARRLLVRALSACEEGGCRPNRVVRLRWALARPQHHLRIGVSGQSPVWRLRVSERTQATQQPSNESSCRCCYNYCSQSLFWNPILKVNEMWNQEGDGWKEPEK